LNYKSTSKRGEVSLDADCLASEHAPRPSPNCAFCEYVARASAAG